MFDNEKFEKENEQFSSAILYVATAVYVAVCAMVFGALYAKKQTFGDAFLLYMKDYGTILAGVPVLVAVVVAKQQLDANRRQHVATVKRSFKTELDVVKNLRNLTKSKVDRDVDWFLDLFILIQNNSKVVKKKESAWVKRTRNNVPDVLMTKSKEIRKQLKKFGAPENSSPPSRQVLEERHKRICINMDGLDKELDEYMRDLAQYWS